MTITFQTKKDKAFYICFGFKSKIHAQLWLISYGYEYYDENNCVEFATANGIFKHPKYWKIFNK